MIASSSSIPCSLQLEAIFARCEGAYSERTLSGYRNDLEQFKTWCDLREIEWLPASPATVAEFIDEETKAKALSTVKRRVEAVKFAHRMFDLRNRPIGTASLLSAMSLLTSLCTSYRGAGIGRDRGSGD